MNAKVNFSILRLFVLLACLAAETGLEFGYLYRFERSRGFADLSDHVLHLNLLFTTKPKPRRPMPNDHFQ